MAKKKDKRDRHGAAAQAASPVAENEAGAGSRPRDEAQALRAGDADPARAHSHIRSLERLGYKVT